MNFSVNFIVKISLKLQMTQIFHKFLKFPLEMIQKLLLLRFNFNFSFQTIILLFLISCAMGATSTFSLTFFGFDPVVVRAPRNRFYNRWWLNPYNRLFNNRYGNSNRLSSNLNFFNLYGKSFGSRYSDGSSEEFNNFFDVTSPQNFNFL